MDLPTFSHDCNELERADAWICWIRQEINSFTLSKFHVNEQKLCDQQMGFGRKKVWIYKEIFSIFTSKMILMHPNIMRSLSKIPILNWTWLFSAQEHSNESSYTLVPPYIPLNPNNFQIYKIVCKQLLRLPR